jgi:hypothetical protein
MNLYSKASLIVLIAVSAFNLGRYSVEFSGTTLGWASLILGIIGMVVCAGALCFSDRKPAN